MAFDPVMFVHLAGLIVGLGAVTVIDLLGFVSRKSVVLTQVTIHAHHVTKPLIWLGTILIAGTWILIVIAQGLTLLNLIKSALLVVMIVNGCFLSLYVSPRLDNELNKNRLLPVVLQQKIAVSMVVSFVCWWSFVVLTVVQFF